MAAFFHDIGHLLAFEEQETKSMGGFGVMHHEGLGEKLLIECGVPGSQLFNRRETFYYKTKNRLFSTDSEIGWKSY